jgi:hypothetical protein
MSHGVGKGASAKKGVYGVNSDTSVTRSYVICSQ